uniref:Uncharacterized protein n=1 Tax=Anguilla anguilla TaxID=7936 RepID=A0A0E9TAV6_ANGAN
MRYPVSVSRLLSWSFFLIIHFLFSFFPAWKLYVHKRLIKTIVTKKF